MREHRVVGPPGCGKTTYLARQAQVAADKYGGPGVVVASLTRTAAAEVAGRGTTIPRKNIGTLHSHAYRALGGPAIVETTEGLTAWNEWVGVSSMRISMKMSANPENATPEQLALETEGDELLQSMGVYRQRMTPPEAWPPSVRSFAAKWEEFKAETGYLDFTDLIERALNDVDELPDSPAVFMLDEAQDMSRLEMGLARKWGAGCEQMVIVGDPDQNLYQWRGSDPEAFYAGEAASERVLEQSYRVPFAVHRAAVAWVSKISGRKEVRYHPRREDPLDPTSRPVEGRLHRKPNLLWEDPVPVVDQLEATAERGSVMVLATCGYMLQPIVAELRHRGVPFHNPYRPEHGGWNPMRGARRMLAFLRPDEATWGEEARFWTWGDVRAFTDPMQAKGYIVRGGKTLIQSKTQTSKLGEKRDEQEASPQTIFDLFLPEHLQALYELDVAWWIKSLRNNEVSKQDYPELIYRRRGGQALRERPRITVGTIHSVKGGEADFVFLFPDLSNQAWETGWRKGAGGGYDAIVRQFYVGMTRAREELTLCGTNSSLAVQW